MTKPNKILTRILDQIYAEGHAPGTPQYEFMLRKRKVEQCQEMKGVRSCQVCMYFDHCELAKEHLRDTAEMRQRRYVAMVEEQKRKEEEVTRRIHRDGILSDQDLSRASESGDVDPTTGAGADSTHPKPVDGAGKIPGDSGGSV